MIFFFFLFALSALACRPHADFVPPTIEQVKGQAELIVSGVVEENSGAGFERDLLVKVEKTLKGKARDRVRLKTGASSCDRLGYEATTGTRCLLYVKGGRTISGVFGGHASSCSVPESSTPKR